MKELRRFTLDLVGENVIRYRAPDGDPTGVGIPVVDTIENMKATIQWLQDLEGQTFRVDKVTIPSVENADKEKISLEIVVLEEEIRGRDYEISYANKDGSCAYCGRA